MKIGTFFLCAGVVAILVAGSAGVKVAAQAGTAAQTNAAQQAEVGKAISAARIFRDANLHTEALNAMAEVIKKYPGNSDAARFQIDTLLLLNRDSDALIAYDAYVKARGRADATALAAIGRHDLRRTAQNKADKPLIVAQALERLARDGDPNALSTLKDMAASASVTTAEGLAPIVSLARLGDGGAQDKMGSSLNQIPSQFRPQVIQAIRDAGAKSQGPALVAAFADADQQVKNAAALALGALQISQGVAPLQDAFDKGNGATKLFAAIALKQLGQRTADTFLEGLLNGQIAEIRVIAAATAYQFSTTKTPVWEKAVRELMSGTNDQYKVQAAEMLACCDMTAARGLLNSALTKPNPLLRSAAAKAFEARKDFADATVARRIMGDSIDQIRIPGAGIALTLAKASPGGAPPAPPAPLTR